jgi:hypothetical protein
LAQESIVTVGTYPNVVFLPVLGFWMIRLGLLFLAQDVPFLQRPILQALT